jgi:potassium-transporting ATPase KdpC subunit
MDIFSVHHVVFSDHNRIFYKMIKHFRPAITLFGLLALVTGLLYPLAVTGIAQMVFPSQANGSLIEKNTVVMGSRLIGQDFTNPRYFWGRPSSTHGSPYTAFDPVALTGSSGSNLGPLSRSLNDSIQARIEFLRAADPYNEQLIPVDLVTASASGLDPDISVAAAYYQAPRVARARQISLADVTAIIDQNIIERQLGFLGEPRVNVLLLNIALDAIK